MLYSPFITISRSLPPSLPARPRLCYSLAWRALSFFNQSNGVEGVSRLTNGGEGEEAMEGKRELQVRPLHLG